MKFYNKTGYDLDSLIVNNKYIGHISKDSSTSFIVFDDITLDTGSPIARLSALMNDMAVATPVYGRCGTEMNVVTEGVYENDIITFDWDNGENSIKGIDIRYRWEENK